MQLSRARVKELRLALGRGDVDAALLLLAHSKALGHERLAIRRYFAARLLGASEIEHFRTYCINAANRILPQELLKMAREAARDGAEREDVHRIAGELLAPVKPATLPFEGVWPRLATKPQLCGGSASLLGKVTMGARSWLGPSSVIRADGHFVEIGDDFHLGERSTVHIAHAILPTIIGDCVTVGRNVVVHACTVGNNCVFEDDVVILDGTTVESGVVVEAGSTVFPRSTLKTGLLYSGSPAKPVRPIEPDELDRRAQAVHEAIAASLFEATGALGSSTALDDRVFVASTATLSGSVVAEPCSGIFFGCKLNAAGTVIAIGRNSNIQDNTIIDATQGAVTMGEKTTIGHNVLLRSSTIGAKTLIGIGSTVDVGTVVDDDVLLAAGSITTPGQHLESGWLWGGRPPRPLSRLDDAKRAMMSVIIEQYCAYGAAYRVAQSPSRKKGGANGTSTIEDCYPDW